IRGPRLREGWILCAHAIRGTEIPGSRAECVGVHRGCDQAGTERSEIRDERGGGPEGPQSRNRQNPEREHRQNRPALGCHHSLSRRGVLALPLQEVYGCPAGVCARTANRFLWW